MKKLLRKLLPESVILQYHRAVSLYGAMRYGFPSRKMVVIGVTGTKGKTSASNYMWSCLSAAGFKVGIISTANIRIGEREVLNAYHMTMPGRLTVHRLMAEMAKEGCTHCVVETTSEGIKQYRHTGIDYDVAVFTNLFPEHLASHNNSFEEYKQTKIKLFKALNIPRKTLNGKTIEKVIIANSDSEHAPAFLAPSADKKVTFGTNAQADYRFSNVTETPEGVTFSVTMPSKKQVNFTLRILGSFNVANAMPGVALCDMFGVDADRIARGLEQLGSIPGRMEKIDEGQDYTVLVDYAHERQSITNVLRTANAMKPEGARTIILLGAEGGGRDKSKRAVMGQIAAEMADELVVSNVDPYEDEAWPIIEDIVVAAEAHGMVRDKNLHPIEDRREGIRQALTLAKKGDVVLITGKGAEQSIIINGISSPWDDRTVVREELRKLHAR